MSRRSLSLFLSGLVGIASIAVAVPGAVTGSAIAAATRTLPTKDSFYRYSGHKSLSKIHVGTVLKTRTVTVTLGSSSTPVTATQVLYRTRNELGKPSVTVTTVLEPATAAVAPNIVAYLSFYDALGSECDPSYTLAGGYPGTADNQQQAEIEEGLIAQYVSAGYVVTIPDFEGTSLDWASGQESGWDTLDAVRATENLLHVHHTTTKVGLSGYSGGSIAAEWASELAPKYAPDLDLVGVAEGGIPVDFAHNLDYINGSQDWSGVIPAVLVSLTRAFHVKLGHYLSAYGKKVTHQVRGDCIGSFLGNYPGLKVQKLLKHKYRDFLAIPAFVHIINHLIMGTAPSHPREPLFMGVGKSSDGKGDGVMVTKDVEGLAHEYCTQKAKVQFSVYGNSDHDDAAVQFEPNATSFLAQRFAGAPFSSGCASIGKGNSLKPVKLHKHH
jgi:hypothetical protein